MPSLPVRGAWIEMSTLGAMLKSMGSRSPCGERGLKSADEIPRHFVPPSLPVRGAWIEILLNNVLSDKSYRRSPCGERGLKFEQLGFKQIDYVAPRAGSVD